MKTVRLEDIGPPSVEEMFHACGVSLAAARNWDKYVIGCRNKFDMIARHLRQNSLGTTNDQKVLDWGCALGGVAILVDHEFPAQVHAADVDRHSIAWLKCTAPAIQACLLEPDVALPFDDNYFDCIYGISVLTHLPRSQQEFYLKELRRILKPGSVVILTVAGYRICEYNRERGKSNYPHEIDGQKLLKHGFLFNSYPIHTKHRIEFAQKSPYGQAYHSPEFIHEVFGCYFEIKEITEGGLLGRQDVVVMRKPASSKN